MANQADFLSDLAASDTPQPQAVPQGDFLTDLAQAPAAAAPQAAQGQPDYSLKGWGKFLGNEGVRIGSQAVAGGPLMAMNLGVLGRNVLGNAYNKVAGNPATPDYELPGAEFERMLNSYTTPPQSMLGKATEFVGQSLLGGKMPMPEISAAPAAQQALGVLGGKVAPIMKTPAAFAPAQVAAQSNLTGAQQQALAGGKPLGMRVTPGQQTGSTALQQLEAKLESQPWTSGPFNAIREGNKSALNRQAALSIGEDAPQADSSVMGKADERMGKVFENVRAPNRISITDPSATRSAIDAIEESVEGLLPSGVTVRGNPLVSRLESLTQSGSINGQQLGKLSSKLGRAAYKEMTSQGGDRDMGQALYAVKDHADDLLQPALSPAEAAQYAAVRSQYRNLMNLTKPGIVNSSTGDVSGANYANLLQRIDKPGFTYGKNQSDLYKAIRFQQAFKPTVGNSGTATRSGMMGLLPLIGAALGGAGGHATLGEGGMGMGLGAIAAPAVMNLGSRAYLRGAMPTAQALKQAPSLMKPLAKPALYGGLIAAE